VPSQLAASGRAATCDDAVIVIAQPVLSLSSARPLAEAQRVPSRARGWLGRAQVSRVQKMLGDEFGTASNIKSRVNRQSVLGAITSAQQRLKLYNRVRSVPPRAAGSRLRAGVGRLAARRGRRALGVRGALTRQCC